MHAERTDTSPTGRETITTSTAAGKTQVVDVDEWLYRAQRVRPFVDSAVYEPKHRAEATIF